MFGRIALRDLAILAAVVLAWATLAPLTGREGPLADGLGVVLGVGAAICAYLGHEWGHLAGAAATRSRVTGPSTLRSVSLFHFDSKANDRRQFLVMSFAGFAMTGLAIAIVYGALPEGLLATRVARGGVVFLGVLTVVLEVPLVVWALLRNDLPPVDGFAAPPPQAPDEAELLDRAEPPDATNERTGANDRTGAKGLAPTPDDATPGTPLVR